jgi:hypothetical protein
MQADGAAYYLSTTGVRASLIAFVFPAGPGVVCLHVCCNFLFILEYIHATVGRGLAYKRAKLGDCIVCLISFGI